MRLLRCADYELVEFIGEPVPSYAILSHTWEKGEVLFSHMDHTRGAVPNPASYRQLEGWFKIQKSCEQALRDGLGYVWVDTICIDKSSSAELSEAINSMFRWYRDSAVCYAFLCDLPQQPLERSRWFTRGWTLQELIAPRRLIFYDSEWRAQGSKDDLLERVREITKIDAFVLRGGNLRHVSVARKMSWAAGRQTTRPEDMAYCLLGLFEIAMPMLYGEGTRAFVRLQEEIIKEYDDHSVFAWRTSRAVPSDTRSGFLASSPADFADSAMFAHLLGDSTAPVTVTSRGLQIETRVVRDGSRWLVVLDCVNVLPVPGADWHTRVAIRIARRVIRGGKLCVYRRSEPNRLYYFTPPHDVSLPTETIFALKEMPFDSVESNSYFTFFVRTMPTWPQGHRYRLVHTAPPGTWDETQSLFQRPGNLDDLRPFVLVFGRDSSFSSPPSGSSNGPAAVAAAAAPPSYFFVFLSIEMGPGGDGRMRRQRCCSMTHRTAGWWPEDLQLDRGVQPRVRGTGAIEVEGGGVKLKLFSSVMLMMGQSLFCVDFSVDLSDAGPDAGSGAMEEDSDEAFWDSA